MTDSNKNAPRKRTQALRCSLALALASTLTSAPALADQAGICGQWTGEVVYVLDSGAAQTWAHNFSEGDVMRGAFMKRGVADEIRMTENTNPWHQHVNTYEIFTNHGDWAMNVNVNGFTFEQDSHNTPGPHRLRVMRRDTTRIDIYGDRRDSITWWTDWAKVSEEIEYFGRYHLSVKFVGPDFMLQTPNGESAGAADLQPAMLDHVFGTTGIEESLGVVQLRAHGGFDGNAQVTGRITNVQLFPCDWVDFDAETGRYSANPSAGVHQPGNGGN